MGVIDIRLHFPTQELNWEIDYMSLGRSVDVTDKVPWVCQTSSGTILTQVFPVHKRADTSSSEQHPESALSKKNKCLGLVFLLVWLLFLTTQSPPSTQKGKLLTLKPRIQHSVWSCCPVLSVDTGGRQLTSTSPMLWWLTLGHSSFFFFR